MTTKSILIVDDEIYMVGLLEKILTKEGYKTIPCHSGREAIETIQSGQKVDLLISDLKMPHVAGIDVIEIARGNDIPTIIVSGGVGTDTHIRHLKSLGYTIPDSEFIYKPIKIDLLLTLVKSKLANKN
ncbi:MAG: response regulator [Endomicrobiales bacterium]|nr:response regulator [Endomicrobiales bacterium]